MNVNDEKEKKNEDWRVVWDHVTKSDKGSFSRISAY